jgi:NAD(P)-dependent dehydrogenase (short-subunit alcohol dehydrogenase family)
MSSTDYSQMLSLQGRLFVVLGAGQGIGEEVVQALSQCGARVVCADSVLARAERVAAAHGGIAMQADVTRPEDMRQVFGAVAELPSDGPLGVVNVVGMVIRNELQAQDEGSWKRQFELVLDHAWLTLHFGAKAMVDKGGCIIFIGSIAGHVVRSGAALAYASAKAGLHHLAKGAAHELARSNIRVNVVAPGLTRTPRLVANNSAQYWEQESARIPMGRPGETSDVASAVLYLASPLAAYVTGNVIAVDGGSSLGAVGAFKLANS